MYNTFTYIINVLTNFSNLFKQFSFNERLPLAGRSLNSSIHDFSCNNGVAYVGGGISRSRARERRSLGKIESSQLRQLRGLSDRCRVQWHLDITKGQSSGEMYSLKRDIVRYTEHIVM